MKDQRTGGEIAFICLLATLHCARESLKETDSERFVMTKKKCTVARFLRMLVSE